MIRLNNAVCREFVFIFIDLICCCLTLYAICAVSRQGSGSLNHQIDNQGGDNDAIQLEK